jgi:hypothetical protein
MPRKTYTLTLNWTQATLLRRVLERLGISIPYTWEPYIQKRDLRSVRTMRDKLVKMKLPQMNPD